MLISLQIRAAILALVIVISLGLVFFVYRYSKDRKANYLFAFFNLSLLGWLITVYLAIHPSLSSYSTFWARLSIAFGIGLGLFIALLARLLVRGSLPARKYYYAFLVVSAVLFLFCLTPYVFKEAPVSKVSIVAIPAWGMSFYAAYTILTTTYAVVVLVKGIKQADQIQRKRIGLVLFGFLGMHVAFIFSIMLPIILWENANFVQFGGLYILFFLICTAIAIVKYHLFNIRIIATEFLVLIFNSILFIQLAASNSIKRGVLNGLLLVLCGALSYLLLKYARRELKEGQEKVRFEALEESNRRLQALDKQKTEFLNIAAHQLRTPTSVVNNYLAMIKDGDYGVVGAELKPVMDNIEASNQWLIKLADKLLYLSKIEQGDIKYHFEACDIVSLIKKIIAEFIPLADEKGLKIVFSDNGGEALNVSIDEEKIKLAVFNLLDNAVRYSEAGIIKVETMDEKREEKSGVTVRVIDQGIGFAPEDKEKFFHKFQRGANASGTNVHNSTGLGLYLVRKFVEGHGGNAWAKSEGVNMGSEFGVWLPVKK